MDCVLIQPPLRVSEDFVDYPYHCDLGVVQAAAVLRRGGVAVRVVDAFALPGSGLERLDEGYVRLGASAPEVAAAVGEASVVVVAYAPFHRPPARDPALAELLVALRAQAPRTPVLLADLYQSGQHYVEASGDRVLSAWPEVDGWLKYEAEDVLTDLVRELSEGGRPAEPRAVRGKDVADLNALPPPAWDLVDLPARDVFMQRLVSALGRGAWAFPVDGRTLPAISSRGCPYRCAHCSSNPARLPSAPKTQRRCSAKTLGRLVDTLATEHGATRIDFLDEMVNVSSEHMDGLLEVLSEHDVRYDFPNGMRADWVTAAQLERMQGRITTLSVSAESGVQAVVDEVVGKGLDLDAVEGTVAAASQLGISTMVHFIIGMPGETRRDINGTLEYAVRLFEEHGAWPAVQYATPLPGTQLATTTEAAAEKARAPLPDVEDYGPLFQHTPVTRGADFTPEDLRRFKWTFDQRIKAGGGPTKVIVNVTYRCNNYCTFCAVGNRTQLDGSFDRQRQLLYDYRRKGLRLVDFDGGEPTLYEGLIPLVRYARKVGYEGINVTTNGRMCAYEDYAQKLVNSGLTTLLFSVHGPDPETHYRQVGVREAFEQTTQGIRNCVAAAPEGVDMGMNITLTRSNHDTLQACTQLAWDLGLRWLNIQFLTPFGRATVNVNPDTAIAARTTMAVIDEWRDRMKFQVINLPFCFMPGYEEFLLGDLLKIQRYMVFVNNEDVNLYDYLKERRAYAEECQACPHKVFCGGFYEMDDVPEVPWTFTHDDVVAPLLKEKPPGP